MDGQFYYVRENDAQKSPVVTVYLGEQDGVFVRGVAVCNPKDQVQKKVGRAIAKGKAVQALSHKKSMHRMPQVCRDKLLLLRAPSLALEDYMAVYNSALTGRERGILAKAEANELP